MNRGNKKCRANYATFDVAMASTLTADNWESFGRWVLQKREQLGMRQEDLAEKIGSDRQTVYRIEKGGSTKRRTVIKIANALGQSPHVAIEIAFGIQPQEIRTGESIEEVLRNAHFFHAKGLSEADMAVIRPILEALDKQIEKLKEE